MALLGGGTGSGLVDRALAAMLLLAGTGTAEASDFLENGGASSDHDTPAIQASPSAGASDNSADPVGAAPASWTFSVTPYLWFSGLSGDIGVFPDVEPVEADLSFTDIFENLDFAAMVMLQAQRGRFVAIADITYVDIGTSKDVGIRDPEFAEVDLDTQTFMSTVAAGYRAIDTESMALDLVAGARISAVDTRLALTGPNRALVGDSSKTWIDPIVGTRIHVPLGNAWALTFYGDVGGFGVSSDVTWQLLGVAQYGLGGGWTLAAGWREYGVDYQKDDFVYDVTMGGPILGVTYRF